MSLSLLFSCIVGKEKKQKINYTELNRVGKEKVNHVRYMSSVTSKLIREKPIDLAPRNSQLLSSESM